MKPCTGRTLGESLGIQENSNLWKENKDEKSGQTRAVCACFPQNSLGKCLVHNCYNPLSLWISFLFVCRGGLPFQVFLFLIFSLASIVQRPWLFKSIPTVACFFLYQGREIWVKKTGAYFFISCMPQSRRKYKNPRCLKAVQQRQLKNGWLKVVGIPRVWRLQLEACSRSSPWALSACTSSLQYSFWGRSGKREGGAEEHVEKSKGGSF